MLVCRRDADTVPLERADVEVTDDFSSLAAKNVLSSTRKSQVIHTLVKNNLMDGTLGLDSHERFTHKNETVKRVLNHKNASMPIEFKTEKTDDLCLAVSENLTV